MKKRGLTRENKTPLIREGQNRLRTRFARDASAWGSGVRFFEKDEQARGGNVELHGNKREEKKRDIETDMLDFEEKAFALKECVFFRIDA